MKKLWVSFALVFFLSFAVLGWIGTRIYQKMPPIPNAIVTTDGAVVVPPGDIERGQNVWQDLGGMEVGSVWGHGSYVAPDWTADWLHREATFVLDDWANKEFGTDFDHLSLEDRGKLRGRLESIYRRNTYDPATHNLVIEPVRAKAVVSALILVQILMGVITAHYGVEGDAFYGIKLSHILPYSVTRTWHVQLGIFWIATAWLAAGLFIGPLVSKYEPKFQALGVHVLFGALLLIVVGSMAGEWMSIHNKLAGTSAFLWGHQGYEYVDLGRGWQILLFVGLLIWLFLVVRAVRPALKQAGDQRQLLWLFIMSAAAIGLFYGAGLSWGQHTHLSIVEYWRWWVVHLWVEGFFEVFATTVIAFSLRGWD
jgi:nitric oxide reductase large subunit